MADLVDGQRGWTASRDAEGHREYKVTYLIRLTEGEGPKAAFDCPGLPTVGDSWAVDDDSDDWATLLPTATLGPHMAKDGDPYLYVKIEMTYSTKPPDPSKARCNDTPVEDPLLEPMKVSGSYTRFQEEATADRYGKPIKTSSHELIRGPHVEFDRNRATIKVEQNVPVLGIEVFGPMIDTVNDRPMWGLPKRCIKLSTPSWERKYYGKCSVYYTRSFTFEINVEKEIVTGNNISGWDRALLDEGTKVLNGHWDQATGAWHVDDVAGDPADPTNPEHFIRAKDSRGENISIILNGSGLPAGKSVVGTPITIVNTTVLTDNSNPTISNQPNPDLPAKLLIQITDDDTSMEQGIVVITGTNTDDNVITDTVYLTFAGTSIHITENTYKTVTQITVGGDPPLVGAGGSDTIKIITDVSQTDEGRVVVEKYTESNFLLLGIPLVL